MSKDRDRAFFGHPIGLSTLFFTEMWERFSYYGMRAILTLYIIAKTEHGGLGMTIEASGIVYALYTATVYMLALPGGWIADRFLGQRRAVVYGGVGIALGNVLLAIPTSQLFFPGLATIAIGTGLLKPNISTIVGQLYSADDVRRDSGFTVYYFGINLGAGIAPFACGFFAQSEMFRGFLADHGIDPGWSWHFAFGAAAIGMIAGLVQYIVGFRNLGDAGLHPHVPADPRRAARDRTVLAVIIGGVVALIALAVALVAADASIGKDTIANVFGLGLLIAAVALFVGMLRNARDADEKRRIIAMIPLFLGGVAFFGTFEQAGSTLNIFAEQAVERIVPASYYQNINASFILILAPVFAALWLWLGKRGKEPTSVTKFAIGMVFAALAFVVVLPSLGSVTYIANLNATLGQIPFSERAVDQLADPVRVSWLYLLALYFFQTTSELCISPVGLSSMSKLAPTRMAGMVMGTWFLATAIGDYLAGRAAGVTASRGYGFLFDTLIVLSVAVAAALWLVSPIIRRMMAGGASVAPLPKAHVVEPPAEDIAS